MIIEIKDNREMFGRALDWLKNVKYIEVDLTKEDIAALFYKEFKCKLMLDNILDRYIAGEFDSETDASMFVLRWS